MIPGRIDGLGCSRRRRGRVSTRCSPQEVWSSASQCHSLRVGLHWRLTCDNCELMLHTARHAARSSLCAEAFTAIEADLEAFSPGRTAAHDGHGRLMEGKRALCELRQTAAVSRCVSELHGKKYRILEIYPFAARKPVRTCPRGLQGQRSAVKLGVQTTCSNEQVPRPFS